MAKRFISTELFDDEWFCNLSKDSKLFFIYFITKCDHAGILRFNKRLFEFQTGINSFDTLIKDFTNSLITVKENVYFMPKYLKFQYPDFPKSNVRQQDSAISILKSFGLWDENLNSYLRVKKELPNSYDNDIDNDNDIVIEDEVKPEPIFQEINLDLVCNYKSAINILVTEKNYHKTRDIYKLTNAEIEKYILEFLKLQEADHNISNRYLSEVWKHFNRWLKINIKNTPPENEKPLTQAEITQKRLRDQIENFDIYGRPKNPN
jgi:hypothetical protein